ncbi:uncharacterized protein LOC131153271 [Malania oleifera]|uniref:uncharacterized protein LOC131153271 n=1 Tax=Malania oleifera TaxID=397392 RepID=UPI0025AE0026|nr:uncharacterized protein LOC131153271 [Malania oleifera]
MGKKLDTLLGRSFKTHKFKALVRLAISRLAALKNRRQVCLSQDRSNVVQLLNLGHHEQALLRVEHVIKEQNMLDVFSMMGGYFLLLIERVHLLEQEKVCPNELEEAIASLLFASSRCGEFPELQEIRAVFKSRFGKEFTDRAIELRNNCGVNPKIVQKLSTRQPSLETRMKALKEIASENSIALQLEEVSIRTEEKLGREQKPNQPRSHPSVNSSGDGSQAAPEEIEMDEEFSSPMKMRQYRDVADAAQAAFKSAAYAAAAARAAVVLSRSESQDPDDQNSPSSGQEKGSDCKEPMESKDKTTGNKETGEVEKIHPIENYHLESEDKKFNNEKRPISASSSDSEDTGNANVMPLDVLGKTKPLEKGIAFDGSDDEKSNLIRDDLSQGNGEKSYNSFHEQIPQRFQSGLKIGALPNSTKGSVTQSAQLFNMRGQPFSVRTRR